MLFPHFLFPPYTLLYQLAQLANEQSRLSASGMGQTVMIFQIFLLLYISVKTIYALLKRDNFSETTILMLFPMGMLFVTALMQCLSLGPFLDIRDYNPRRALWLLQDPFFCVQILLAVLAFALCVGFYLWMDKRLNQSGTSPVMLVVSFGFETAVAAASIVVGVNGVLGQNAWTAGVSPVLIKWYIYGLCLLTGKSLLYFVAVAYSLAFANRQARRRLFGMEEPLEEKAKPPSAVPSIGELVLEQEFGLQTPYQEFGKAAGPEQDADAALKRYIRRKAFPYVFGLGLVVAAMDISLPYLQYRSYLQGTFYDPEDTRFVLIFCAVMTVLFFSIGLGRNLMNALFPGRSAVYRSFRRRGDGERLTGLFYREFFQNKPVFTAGRMLNLILTEHFLVTQSIWLSVLYLDDVRECQFVYDSFNRASFLVVTLADGKKKKINVNADSKGVIKRHLDTRIAQGRQSVRGRGFVSD